MAILTRPGFWRIRRILKLNLNLLMMMNKTRPRFEHFDLKQRLSLKDSERHSDFYRQTQEVSDLAFYSCLAAVFLSAHLLFLAAVYFSDRFVFDQP